MAKENMFAKASKKRSEELGETVTAVETGVKPKKKIHRSATRELFCLFRSALQIKRSYNRKR